MSGGRRAPVSTDRMVDAYLDLFTCILEGPNRRRAVGTVRTRFTASVEVAHNTAPFDHGRWRRRRRRHLPTPCSAAPEIGGSFAMTADPLTSEPTHLADRCVAAEHLVRGRDGECRRRRITSCRTSWWPGLVARIGGTVGSVTSNGSCERSSPRDLARDELRRRIGPGSPLGHSVHPVLNRPSDRILDSAGRSTWWSDLGRSRWRSGSWRRGSSTRGTDASPEHPTTSLPGGPARRVSVGTP